MDIKEDQQVWCVKFLIRTRDQDREMENVNEMLAQELHKPLIKKFKEVMPMWGLKIIF